jgi:hypothetical protein
LDHSLATSKTRGGQILLDSGIGQEYDGRFGIASVGTESRLVWREVGRDGQQDQDLVGSLLVAFGS